MKPGRKRFWLFVGALILVILLIVAGIATYYAHRLEPMAREQLVAYLSDKFDSDVELKELKVSAIPRLHVVGKGLILRWKHRQDVPPMIRLGEFTFNVDWADLTEPAKHIALVRLKDFELNLPPRSSTPNAAATEAPKPQQSSTPVIIVNQIIADKTMLRLLPKDPEKPVKEFELHELRLLSVGGGKPFTYRTRMMNYKPPGLIDSVGQFGPWNRDDPGSSSLAGKYTFDNADLGVFKGIEGVLTSKGQFNGQLNHIWVDGTADVPDFRLKMTGQSVPLKTKFHALVDGTNGNTILEPVEATIGKTPMTVRGGVIGEKNVKGKSITLDVVMKGGHLDDLMRLAVKGRPPLTGAVSMNTKLVIPREDVDVIEKLGLDGRVFIGGMRFTNRQIQDKIDELSRRGQGHPGDESIARVQSRLVSSFVLKDTVIRFRNLKYGVQGAEVELDGHYGIKQEDMNFDGVLRLDAKASQTFRGMKSIMLKAFDPLVSRRNRGTVLSIKIEGTREHPKFGLDVGRTLKKKDK